MLEVRTKYDFKAYLNKRRVFSYEIADALGISESALSVRIRRASEKQFAELCKIADQVAKKRA